MAKKKKKKGLHIGGYTITPLGLGILAGLIVVIAAVAVLAATGRLGGGDNVRRVVINVTEAPTEDPNPTATPVPATPTPVPTPSPTPEPREATVRVLGEITMETDLLKSAYDRQTSTFDFDPMFSLIRDVTANADYTIADVEGVMTTIAFSGEQNRMLTPPALLRTLGDMGVDMLMLGNDHALDGGVNGLKNEIELVTNAGFDYVGAAASIEEKVTPKLVRINGFNVGFVSYVEALNIDPASISAGDLAYSVNIVSRSNADADVKALRQAGADLIIAIVNWGELYQTSPTESQDTIATYLASTCGVDMIIGYNPATVQAVKWIENTPAEGIPEKTLVVNAPGNFISAQRDNGMNCGYIFQFDLSDENGQVVISNPTYIPTYVICYEDESGQNQYRTVAVGQWTDDTAGNLPDGMTYGDLQYMGELWSQMQKVMNEGQNIAEIARE